MLQDPSGLTKAVSLGTACVTAVTHRGCFAVVTKGHQFIQEASGGGSPRWQERQVRGLGSHMGLEGCSSARVMTWPEVCMAREEGPGYRLRGLITWTMGGRGRG